MFRTSLVVFLCALPCIAISGDVVEMGANQYSVSKTSGACGFGGTGSIKTSLYKQIGKFCSTKSLVPEVSNIQEQDGVIGRRCARATIEFRCVTSTSVSTVPSGAAPDRDMNHSPSIAADRGQFGRNYATPATTPTDKYEALAKLKDLLDSGALTEAEYETEKRKLLAR